ncbi:Fe(3+) ABC transporter substrate-binding protein [Shewanella sp. SNU WT4]|nr:Fe(3+) ABC transporter substrate-binding protein [Shewanella sp. SNU WT4]
MRLLSGLVLAMATISAPLMAAPDSVTVYSYRQPFLIEPILKDFTAKTGIKVDVVFAKDGIAERIKREGRLSPADLVLTADFSRLMELVELDLVQPVASDSLSAAIPEQFRSRDDLWFSLTKRVRNIYSSKERLGAIDVSYEDLASPQFKGKICTRSGKHPYNIALVASMLSHHGEAETRAWLEGFKANLAQRPQGNDRAQVKAVKEGLCDIAIGNSYYLGSMMMDPEQQAWAESVVINFPNQSSRGAHINVSGMAMTKHAPHQASTLKLMEYLASNEAQTKYAEVNFEYPVNPQVPASAMVASWGKFKEDHLPIQALADNHSAAVKLLDEVKFDL